MKRWWLTGYIFLAVIILLLLAGGAASQGQCDTAKALREAKLYEKAQANYTALLMNDSQLGCAKEGLLALQSEVSNSHYELGQAYETANQADAAHDAYADALKTDPNNSKAKKALARVNGGALTSAYTLLRPWGEILAAIAIFALVIYALFQRIIPWIFGFCKPRLDIQDFDKGATELEIGKGMPAMVEEAIRWFEKESHPHQQFSLVTGPIGKLEIPVDIKSASPNIEYLSKLIEWLFPPNVITLSGFLEMPGIQGAGLTASLVKSQTGEIIASKTFWQKDYEPTLAQSLTKEIDSASYYRLIEPIAIWTFFVLNNSSMVENGAVCKLLCSICSLVYRFIGAVKKVYRIIRYIICVLLLPCRAKRIMNYISINKMILEFKQWLAPCERYPSGDADEFKILNTGNWQSYAYFRAGQHWMSEGKNDNARKMYLKALRDDPENVGALLNLGILYSEDEDHRRALDLLKRVKELAKPDTPEYGFVWFIGTYQLSGTYYYMAKRYRESMSKASEEIKAVERTILNSIEAKQKNNDAVLECYLHRAGEETDILVEAIKRAINAAQESDYTDLGHILDNAKIIKGTINAMERKVSKVSQSELSEVKKIAEDLNNRIDWIKNHNGAVFKSSIDKAEKEAKELVVTIKKAIGELPPVMDESEKLLKIIKKAISELQNEDEALKYIYEAKELTNILKENLIQTEMALQSNKNVVLKCCLSEAKDQANKINEILEDKNTDIKTGLNKAKKVAKKLDGTIRLAANELKESEDKALKLFLNSFEPLAICAQEEILADMGKKGEYDKERTYRSKKPSEYNSGFQYNKACYYSAAGENKTLVEEQNKKYEYYEKALLHLKYALEQESAYVPWAQKDPSLKGVREDEKTKDEFNEIIKKYGTLEEQAGSLSLAGLTIISKTYAEQLKELGIVSYCDILLKANTAPSRVELAKKLGISTALLLRWALLADLMRIVGNTEYINLLEEAGVKSLEALRMVSNPCELADTLNQINKATSSVSQVPSCEIIQKWVREARETKPEVR